MSAQAQAPDHQPPIAAPQQSPGLIKLLSAELAQERLNHDKTRRALDVVKDKYLAAQQGLEQATEQLRARPAPPLPVPQDPELLTSLRARLQATTEANKTLSRDKAQLQAHLDEALTRLSAATEANKSLKADRAQLQAHIDEAHGRLAQIPDVSALHRTIEELEGMIAADRTATLVLHIMTANAEALAAFYLQHVNPKGRPDALDNDKMRRRCLDHIGFKLVSTHLRPKTP